MADKTVNWGGINSGFTEIAPGEYARQVHALNSLNAAVAQQRMFIAASDQLSVSLGGSIRATVQNPAESDKNVYIVRLVGVKEASGFIYTDIYINPDTGLPTTTQSALNAVIGSSQTPNAVIKIDSGGTALSGGVDTGVHMALGGGRTEFDLPPVVVPPGVTMGLNVPVGALESGNGQLAVYWFED